VLERGTIVKNVVHPVPTGNMSVFGMIFCVNGTIGHFSDLLGHFDQKDTADLINIIFLSNDSFVLDVDTTKV